MDRTEVAIVISKKIQIEINKLKKMNFSVSGRYESICVFDNNITPEKVGSDWAGWEEDYGNQIVFSFDLDHRKPKEKPDV